MEIKFERELVNTLTFDGIRDSLEYNYEYYGGSYSTIQNGIREGKCKFKAIIYRVHAIDENGNRVRTEVKESGRVKYSPTTAYYDIDFLLGFPVKLEDTKQHWFYYGIRDYNYVSNYVGLNVNDKLTLTYGRDGDFIYGYSANDYVEYENYIYPIYFGAKTSSNSPIHITDPQYDPIDNYYYYKYSFSCPRDYITPTGGHGFREGYYGGKYHFRNRLFYVDNSFDQELSLTLISKFGYSYQEEGVAGWQDAVLGSTYWYNRAKEIVFKTTDLKTPAQIKNIKISPQTYLNGNLKINWELEGEKNGKSKIYRVTTLTKTENKVSKKELLGEVINLDTQSFEDSDIPSDYLQWHYEIESYNDLWLEDDGNLVTNLPVQSETVNKVGTVGVKSTFEIDGVKYTGWRESIGWLKKNGVWRQIINFYTKLKNPETEEEYWDDSHFTGGQVFQEEQIE